MIDRFIFGVDSLYIRHLLRYNNVLKQKNFLLKSTRNLQELNSWNKIFCDMSVNLVGIKMKFINKLNIEIKEKFGKDLRIGYKPSFDCPEQTGDSFYSRMESVKPSELKYQRSLLGPHLDAFDITLDNEPLRIYSSGEKKINLLMIYIAFIELFKKTNHEYPIFLLDDFDTAIDEKNIDYLIDSYPDMQVIATSVNRNTHFENLIELKKEN
jgi:recombinational DNA repair ATPase RecF